MAARHPDVAAGPAAGGFLPVPVGTEPADLRVALCHARRSHGIGENYCFLFLLSRPSGALPGNAEIFSVRCARVVPATWWRDDLIGLGRTPGAVLIFVDRGVRFEDWIDDSPGLFDVILACKICGISGQRVA